MTFGQFKYVVECYANNRQRPIEISKEKQKIVADAWTTLNRLPCLFGVIYVFDYRRLPIKLVPESYNDYEDYTALQNARKKVEDKLYLYYEKFMKAK